MAVEIQNKSTRIIKLILLLKLRVSHNGSDGVDPALPRSRVVADHLFSGRKRFAVAGGLLRLGLGTLVHWHHHHLRQIHRRSSGEVAAVADRLLHEWAGQELETRCLHRVGHRVSKQVVLTWVHVSGLEFGVCADDWRLLRVLHYRIVADLRRPVLHHVLMHRQDHRVTDRRNRLLVEAHVLRMRREIGEAQLRVYAAQVETGRLLEVGGLEAGQVVSVVL